MKVARNTCYGGFSISNEAILLYLKKMFNCDRPHCYIIRNGNVVEISLEDALTDRYLSTVFFSANPLIEGKLDNTLFRHGFNSNKDRTDPILIEVIEELGKKANGRFAKIEIVDIPDDIEWEIEDYDGVETIREISRSW